MSLPVLYNSSTFTPVLGINKDIHHIIWNVLLTDKMVSLTPELIEQNKIKMIIAILPNKEEYSILSNKIPQVANYVYEYGDVHNMNTNFLEYENISNLIDTLARGECDMRNVLIFCNNGYQRSLPFLTYYLYKRHSHEFESIEKAIEYVLFAVDKENYHSSIDAQITNIKQILCESI